MRISDWSSDVCSSDLVDALPAGGRGPVGLPRARRRRRPGQPVRGSGTTGLTLQERLQPRAFASTPQVRGKDAGWQSLPFLPGASTQRWSGKKLAAEAAPTRAGERRLDDSAHRRPAQTQAVLAAGLVVQGDGRSDEHTAELQSLN